MFPIALKAHLGLSFSNCSNWSNFSLEVIKISAVSFMRVLTVLKGATSQGFGHNCANITAKYLQLCTQFSLNQERTIAIFIFINFSKMRGRNLINLGVAIQTDSELLHNRLKLGWRLSHRKIKVCQLKSVTMCHLRIH